MSNASIFFKRLTHSVQKQSPIILAGVSIAGLVGSVALAIKATKPALNALEEEKRFRHEEYSDDEPLSVLDVIQTTWKFYIPTIGTVLMTTAAIAGSNTILLRRNAALAGTFAMLQTVYNEYQDQVVEVLGDKKAEKVKAAVAQKSIDSMPEDAPITYVESGGNTLILEKTSGRYFWGDVDEIKRIINEFNRRLLSEMTLSLNEFYTDIGLEQTDMGCSNGWDVDKGLLEVEFVPGFKGHDPSQPCAVMMYKRMPINIWG